MHLYWQMILDEYIRTGKFDPGFVVSHRVPLDDMPALYAAFDKRVAGVEKVFVETRFSRAPAPGCPTISCVAEWKD